MDGEMNEQTNELMNNERRTDKFEPTNMDE